MSRASERLADNDKIVQVTCVASVAIGGRRNEETLQENVLMSYEDSAVPVRRVVWSSNRVVTEDLKLDRFVFVVGRIERKVSMRRVTGFVQCLRNRWVCVRESLWRPSGFALIRCRK